MFYINKKNLEQFPSNRIAMQMQFNQLQMERKASKEVAQINDMFGALNAQHAGLTGNDGRKPFDLFREFDSQIVQEYQLDEGAFLLNRLMPLGRSVNIGRTVFEYARASDVGKFQTSMTGEHGTVYDNPDYDTDKTLIPFHDNGFKRNWREYEQLTLENFQDVMVGQQQSLRTHIQGQVSYILDGTDLTVDGTTWNGFRGDTRVEQVDLSSDPRVTFDFTDTTKTGTEIRKAFKALVDILRLENKVGMAATYFVSNEILSNFENYFGLQGANDIQTTNTSLKSITGVADIVGTSALSGNQILAIPLSSQYVQPIIALPTSTRMLSRQDIRDPYCWAIESAFGIMVKNDFEGKNKGAMYAAS